MMRLRRGFTMMELITVMGISAILLTIITIPVVTSFRFSRTGQSMAQAQDKARVVIERISREIGNSVAVRENTGDGGALILPILPSLNKRFEYVKLDLYMPAENPLYAPSGELYNPDNDKIDPTLRTPRGTIVFPSAQGFRLVRYFIGLRDPFSPYINPYDGVLMARSSQRDNLFTLYRAEVDLRRWDPASKSFLPNTDLFSQFDANGNPLPSELDDPSFFIPGDAQKNQRIRNWLARSKPVTELSRMDMILPIIDKHSGQVVTLNGEPRLMPLVQFRPTKMSNEPAEGMLAVRAGQESENSSKFGPDVYKTQYGAWSSSMIRTWPSTFNFVRPWSLFEPWQSGEPYLVGAARSNGRFTIAEVLGNNENDTVNQIFDVTTYLEQQAAGGYAFSAAIAPFSAYLNDPDVRARFVAYALNPRHGKIVASFPITEVGTNAGPTDNRPVAQIGAALTPASDPNTGGNWYDAQFNPSNAASTINGRFNKLWKDWDTLTASGSNPAGFPKSGYVKRFIDLRLLPNRDGTLGPLHPNLGFARARIVPGSEIVIGPDQMNPSNFGKLMRYTRVAQRPVGPNQYYINYVDKPQPDWSLIGLGIPSGDPRVYNSQDFVSAILQPQYMAGYLELNSDPGQPLPNNIAGITVFYRFQFTEPNDVFSVEYDTRQVLDMQLTIRHFPPTSSPIPQTITVNGSATVRNFIR